MGPTLTLLPLLTGCTLPDLHQAIHTPTHLHKVGAVIIAIVISITLIRTRQKTTVMSLLSLTTLFMVACNLISSQTFLCINNGWDSPCQMKCPHPRRAYYIITDNIYNWTYMDYKYTFCVVYSLGQHTLVTNMLVLCANDFYFATKNIHEVCFHGEFIIGVLKM